MSEESIRSEIEWKKNEMNRTRTRITELHSEVDELENEISVLEDNLYLIRESNKRRKEEIKIMKVKDNWSSMFIDITCKDFALELKIDKMFKSLSKWFKKLKRDKKKRKLIESNC